MMLLVIVFVKETKLLQHITLISIKKPHALLTFIINPYALLSVKCENKFECFFILLSILLGTEDWVSYASNVFNYQIVITDRVHNVINNEIGEK